MTYETRVMIAAKNVIRMGWSINRAAADRKVMPVSVAKWLDTYVSYGTKGE